MRHTATEVLKTTSIELVWLASSYALAFGIVQELFSQPTLDIQMHNTYFVLSIPYAVTPLFAVIASVITSIRLVNSCWKTAYTTAVMVGLSLLWLFIVVVILLLALRIRRF